MSGGAGCWGVKKTFAYYLGSTKRLLTKLVWIPRGHKLIEPCGTCEIDGAHEIPEIDWDPWIFVPYFSPYY